ncbi:MAG: class I mannose-6-phosphate isomerase [Cyclobacteriaceae bacterium]|nr:class I mannose-6-phosphate isomerase [Cyclobacteriaceae bacterium]
MAKTDLYPFLFKTIYKEKIWGGDKIKSHLEKDFGALPNCGETWEISTVPGDVSEVANGALEGTSLKELINIYKDELVGKKNYEEYKDDFPLLIKFIDANDDLSVQVHPDDDLATTRHGSRGKTEMWYIIQADEEASLITGFNREMNRELYQEYDSKNQISELLNREVVNKGDVFYIPAGRIHTIGKGILLAEIQQSSDVTYRIYDFDRKDSQGNYRELHNDLALDALDYTFHKEYRNTYVDDHNKCNNLVTSTYFKTNKFTITESIERDYSTLDSFIIYICIEGEALIQYSDNQEINIKKGEVYLLPAIYKNTTIKPLVESIFLEVST